MVNWVRGNRLVATLSVVTAVVAAAVAASAAEEKRTPVMVGGEPDLDACGGVGVVIGLKPVPGNVLSVGSGPGLEYSAIDSLAAGTRVYLCDRKGRWVGVVYASATTDCGVASARAHRGACTGPCKAGWVYDQYIELMAG